MVSATTMNVREIAAESGADFIVAQILTTSPSNDAALVVGIWTLYWEMYSAGLLACSYNTRCILRNRYGSWTTVGVADAFGAFGAGATAVAA